MLDKVGGCKRPTPNPRDLRAAPHGVPCALQDLVGRSSDAAVLLPLDAFEKALAAMGLDRDASERLARESGQSPTILRRRLSKIDAIRIPPWAGDAAIARTLIPMAFIGTWQAGSNADCEIISVLAGRSPQEIEESVARLLQFDDCPVWSVSQYRGVASKIDAVFAVAKVVTAADVRDFLFLAEYVLSESDPALELPEDKRWAAGIYGKLRNHSAILREGVCETLLTAASPRNHPSLRFWRRVSTVARTDSGERRWTSTF